MDWPMLKLPRHVDLRHVGKDSFVLLEGVEAHWLNGGSLSVPTGYLTDLYSVPRFFRRVMGPVGLSAAPAILHDALYTNDAKGGEDWTREDADRFLYECMRVAGYSWIIRQGAYLAVRVGGWTMWRDGEGEGAAA